MNTRNKVFKPSNLTNRESNLKEYDRDYQFRSVGNIFSQVKNEISAENSNIEIDDEQKSANTSRSPFRPRLALLPGLEEKPLINIDLGNPFQKFTPTDPSSYIFERLKSL